ncbi:MAG: hypothetical protein U0694_08675 [Anaerolineae bacterium]
MSPYIIQKFVDEPIVMMVINNDYKLAVHGQQGTLDVITVLNAQEEPPYCIIDMRALQLNFNDILYLVSLITNRQQSYDTPNAREVVMVTEKGYIKAAMDGLRNPLFGSINIPVYDSLDAALAYVRSQIAAQ